MSLREPAASYGAGVSIVMRSVFWAPCRFAASGVTAVVVAVLGGGAAAAHLPALGRLVGQPGVPRRGVALTGRSWATRRLHEQEAVTRE